MPRDVTTPTENSPPTRLVVVFWKRSFRSERVCTGSPGGAACGGGASGSWGLGPLLLECDVLHWEAPEPGHGWLRHQVLLVPLRSELSLWLPVFRV